MYYRVDDDVLLQLCSLYALKPPISKAKIIQVTKTALKALKYYKHVVHSIEKFIQKVSLGIVIVFNNCIRFSRNKDIVI